jgi:hypothetical protein
MFFGLQKIFFEKTWQVIFSSSTCHTARHDMKRLNAT